VILYWCQQDQSSGLDDVGGPGQSCRPGIASILATLAIEDSQGGDNCNGNQDSSDRGQSEAQEADALTMPQVLLSCTKYWRSDKAGCRSFNSLRRCTTVDISLNSPGSRKVIGSQSHS
jgi:hypothetical protein